MIRILLAMAAIGLMSLSAFAQDLPGTQLTGTPEQNEIVRKATAERIKAGAMKCVNCDLFQVDLSYQELPNRDLSNSRLRQADLSLATFDRSKFVNTNLSIVNAFGARFEDADFTEANLQDATMVGAWFGGANFASANLSNANLSGAYLVTAKNLTQYQLNTACGDASTELPKGLKLAHCKAGGVEVQEVAPAQPAPQPASGQPVIETPAAAPAPTFAQPPSPVIAPAQIAAQSQTAEESKVLAGAPSQR
jgi:uncharacterized protein YjbI with pentapeptide repeats